MKIVLPTLVALIALIASSSRASVATADESESATFSEFQGELRDAHNLLIRSDDAPAFVRFDEKCCKVCTKGKACGNSCINRDYQCHQPPGCACDG